jgi:hypothetical protein
MPPASPARTIPPEHVPPLDLATYRERNARIVRAREDARKEYEEQGIEEAEAEHEYRRRKAIRIARHRLDNKGVTEAEILAEGDVAEWKMKRDTAHVLARAAQMRWAELERNAASLRKEADFGELIA